MFNRILFIALLVPLMSTAEPPPTPSADDLVGSWTGVLVVRMDRQKHNKVLLVAMDFKKDGTVVITPTGEKAETQKWTLEKGVLKFIKDTGKVDAVTRDLQLNKHSIVSKITPGDGSSPDGMTMQWFMGRVPDAKK